MPKKPAVRRARMGRVYWRNRSAQAPKPKPVVVKDLTGRVLAVRQPEDFATGSTPPDR